MFVIKFQCGSIYVIIHDNKQPENYYQPIFYSILVETKNGAKIREKKEDTYYIIITPVQVKTPGKNMS